MADQNQTVQQQADTLKPQQSGSQPAGDKGRQESDRPGAAKPMPVNTQGRPGETGGGRHQENERTGPGVAIPLKGDVDPDLKGRQENDQRTDKPASERAPAAGTDTRAPTQR